MFTIISPVNRLNKAILILVTTLACSQPSLAHKLDSGNFRFDIGFGSREQSPIILVGGLGYKNFVLRMQGMGIHNGPNDFWCGIRGSLLWTFFKNLPFNFDVGVGGGYEYAQAPNKMHQALNRVNKARYVQPYNYKEELDVSIELWTHFYGFYTQIGVPAYQFKSHDSSTILWGAGYMVSF